MSWERDIPVLYLEDDEDLRELVPTFLERECRSLSVSTVGSVSAAVDRIESTAFDCVLSDYELPESDGLTFLDRVRERYPGIPFVLYTGKHDEDLARRATGAGVDGFVRKGSGTDQYAALATRIETLVQRWAASIATEQTRVGELPFPAVLFDRDRSVTTANDAAAEFLDAENPRMLDGHEMPELLVPDHREHALQRFRLVFEDRSPVPAASLTVRTLTGETKTAVVRTVPTTHRGSPAARATVIGAGPWPAAPPRRLESHLSRLGVERPNESQRRRQGTRHGAPRS